MPFIVLEGIEATGKDTQIEKLKQYLESKNIPYIILKFPDKEGPLGKAIYEYLEQEKDFSKEAITLMFIADFLRKKKLIEEERNNRLVIANRYFLSTLAYEGALGIDMEKLLRIAKDFELPEPDAVIYIDITAETSYKRKYKDKNGNPDVFEENVRFLRDVRENYLKLLEEQPFGKKWYYIDGEQSIEDVYCDIVSVIDEYI